MSTGATPGVAPALTAVAGSTFTASIIDPAGIVADLGARVEVPVTRAVVSYWREAAESGGLWTVTLDSPLEPGGYQLVWRTGDPEPPAFEAFIPLVVVAADLTGSSNFPPVNRDAIRPTVEDVARLERSRTVDDNGNDVQTFTDTTHPNVDDVDGLIEVAVQHVMNMLPAQLDPELYDQARWAATLEAAILLETSFFRVQSTGPGASSSVGTYSVLFGAAIKALQPTVDRYTGLA